MNYSSERQLTSRLHITVSEGLNSPPTLVATDGRKTKLLYDPNPQLRGVNLGDAQIYNWTDPQGRRLSAGIVFPPNYSRARAYPLVIQTHGFEATRFLSSGAYESGFAARALAGRGIIVLQVAEPEDHLMTPAEIKMDGEEVYLSAIKSLTDSRIIDPARVGIIGFSRTGIYVASLLSKSPSSIAAAAMYEAEQGDMSAYLMGVDHIYSDWTDSYEAFFGSQPFGKGLEKWLQNAPGFNSQLITAPVIISAADAPNLNYSWPLYSELRIQHKPVDLIYFRTGRHNLMKSDQRLLLQETTVDWFDFWLNSHEDPSPAKLAQYNRWRNLRMQRDRARASPGSASE